MKFEFSNKHDFLLVCSESDFCPYCPKKIKCTEHHLLTKHWKWASLLTSGSEDKYIIPCHCLQLQSSSSRSHWHCPVCQILITRSLNFKGHMDKQHGIYVYVKICPICATPVRYQEYSSGFHNFNDRIFWTILLCILITSSFQNHTAIGRFLTTMEDFMGMKFHHDTLRKAFFHFSAMRTYSYNFCCIRCGHHPAILVGDANWKLSFDIPIHLFKRPILHDAKEGELEVDIENSWQNTECRIIASGICDGNEQKNPYCTQLDYTHFVPWVGSATRVGPKVPKTEAKKGLPLRCRDENIIKEEDKTMNEDKILLLLESTQATNDELIKACQTLGVSGTGSQSDLINRLQELVLYKEIYPKMFSKLQRTGGGVLHMGCIHSFIYYGSPLWWQEPARDHADGLLSFLYPPSIYISDIAGQVARHTNNRTHQQFFQPNDRRLCAATEENIQKATEKTLKIKIPWLKNIISNDPMEYIKMSDKEFYRKQHPISGTHERLSLYDRFHEKNQKRGEEKLRSIALTPDLLGYINTAEAEQVNRALAPNRYFVCDMKELHFLFSVRLLFHLNNEKINKKFEQQMKNITSASFTLLADGRIALEGTDVKEKQRRKSKECVKTEPKQELTHKETLKENVIHRFSVEDFPIISSDEEFLKKILNEDGDEEKTLALVGNSPINLKNLRSLCPINTQRNGIHRTQDGSVNWLTDDILNARIYQIVSDKRDHHMIETFRFGFWWRELQTLGTVKQNISSLKDIHKESIVFFPRVVAGSSPEKGNHFILWVLNGKTHIIQVFDSLGIYNSIEDDDMNILCNIFSHIWDLQNWKIEYPIQWKQTDSESCGVFVCTAADVVSRGILMSSEGLSADNLQHLRRYHASSLMQILRKQMEKVASVPQETELHTEQLTPKDDTVRAAERVFEKRKTRKSLVQGIDGTECMAAKVMVCLYQESDDLKKKSLYPKEQKLEWIECENCRQWIHSDCADVRITEYFLATPFYCGCHKEFPLALDRLRNSLKISGIENLLTEDEMKEYANNVLKGKKKSNRMFLFSNPTCMPKLKQELKMRMTIFNENDARRLMEQIKKVLRFSLCCRNTPLMIDVSLPEITIKLLQKIEGLNRYEAEVVLMRGYFLPSDEDELDEVQTMKKVKRYALK